MIITAGRLAAVAAAIAASLILISCSMGPTPPQKGTPAFYWQAAKETWATGDTIKTIENLDNICKTENEYTSRARAWLLVASSGIAKGYIDLAEYFEGGGRLNKSDSVTFRKQLSNSRGFANRMALRFAETFGDFQKGKDDPVTFDFAFPTGSPSIPVALNKIGNGLSPTQGDIDSAEKGALQRGVVLATCRAAGSPSDAAKVQAVFKAGGVKVSRAVFITAMAAALHDQAQLYTRNKLDEPEKLRLFCERAQSALNSVPSSKETKELTGKIQTTLKKSKL